MHPVQSSLLLNGVRHTRPPKFGYALSARRQRCRIQTFVPVSPPEYASTLDVAQLGRLVQATSTDGTVDYQYDPRGQLIAADYTAAVSAGATAIASKSQPNMSLSRKFVFHAARFCLLFRLPRKVSRLSRLTTNFLRKPKFSATSPLRSRLASSPRTTSSTQCMLSIPQCSRTEVANSPTFAGRLLM